MSAFAELGGTDDPAAPAMRPRPATGQRDGSAADTETRTPHTGARDLNSGAAARYAHSAKRTSDNAPVSWVTDTTPDATGVYAPAPVVLASVRVSRL